MQFKFTSSKGAKVEITLEEDIDDMWYIIISTKINGEETKKVRAGISSFIGKNGVFLVYTNPKNSRRTAICLNDCPELLKYLFYIGKNRNLLEDYI